MNSSRLDLHHDGLSTAAERQAFERELAARPELAAELDLQRRIDARLAALFAAPGSALGPGSTAFRARFTWMRDVSLAAAALLLFGLCLDRPLPGARAADGRAWGPWFAAQEREADSLIGCAVSWHAPAVVSAPSNGFPLALSAGTSARPAHDRGLAGTSAWWIEWPGGRCLVLLGPAEGTPLLTLAPADQLVSATRDFGATDACSALRVHVLARDPGDARAALERLGSR